MGCQTSSQDYNHDSPSKPGEYSFLVLLMLSCFVLFLSIVMPFIPLTVLPLIFLHAEEVNTHRLKQTYMSTKQVWAYCDAVRKCVCLIMSGLKKKSNLLLGLQEECSERELYNTGEPPIYPLVKKSLQPLYSFVSVRTFLAFPLFCHLPLSLSLSLSLSFSPLSYIYIYIPLSLPFALIHATASESLSPTSLCPTYSTPMIPGRKFKARNSSRDYLLQCRKW